jgi:hypothetical protein
MMAARFDFVQFLAEKQQSDAPHSGLVDIGLGLGNVVVGALTFLAPLILLAIVFFRRLTRANPAAASAWARSLTLVPAFGLGLLILDVVVLRATQFEERYFMSALLIAPLALMSWIDRRASRLERSTAVMFVGATLAVTLIVAGGLWGRALFYNESCSRCWDEMAMPELVHQVRAEAGFQHGTIIADHYNVGGNMSVAFPGARVIAANYIVEEPRQDAGGQCLLVWNARNAGDPLPPSLAGYLAHHHLTLPAGGPTYVDAPLLRSADRMDRFAYWLLPNADGNCDPRLLTTGL